MSNKYTLTDFKKGRVLYCAHRVPIWAWCDACIADAGSKKKCREEMFWSLIQHMLFGAITIPAFDAIMEKMKETA